MGSIRRVRNLAFLGLLVTLVWSGSTELRADSGGFYCGYGDCVLTYDDCNGSWDYVQGGGGQCVIQYTVGLLPAGGGGGSCNINLNDGGSFHWEVEYPGGQCGDNYCFVCLQN